MSSIILEVPDSIDLREGNVFAFEATAHDGKLVASRVAPVGAAEQAGDSFEAFLALCDSMRQGTLTGATDEELRIALTDETEDAHR